MHVYEALNPCPFTEESDVKRITIVDWRYGPLPPCRSNRQQESPVSIAEVRTEDPLHKYSGSFPLRWARLLYQGGPSYTSTQSAVASVWNCENDSLGVKLPGQTIVL